MHKILTDGLKDTQQTQIVRKGDSHISPIPFLHSVTGGTKTIAD